MLKVETVEASTSRKSSSFYNAAAKRHYWLLLIGITALAVASAFGLLAYKNPMPFGTERFWLIAERRFDAVTAMLLVAICQ